MGSENAKTTTGGRHGPQGVTSRPGDRDVTPWGPWGTWGGFFVVFNHFDLLPVQPTNQPSKPLKAFKALKPCIKHWPLLVYGLKPPYQTLYIMVMSVKSVCLGQISKKTQVYVVAM